MDFNGFWGSFAKRAREAVLYEDRSPEKSKQQRDQDQDRQDQQEQKREAPPAFQKGLDVIASSLSRIGDTLGNAIEESLNVLAPEPKITTQVKDKASSIHEEAEILTTNAQQQNREETSLDNQTQLKASRDVAMAMAAKVKLLLRELKTLKTNLTFMKERCTQLEEENKHLRESLDRKGLTHESEEDDLVRKQLELLVAEKSRLAQQNANYARENQFLHEVIEYHQLTLQDVSLLDERIEQVAGTLPEA